MAKAIRRLGKGFWVIEDNGKLLKRKISRKPINNNKYIGDFVTIGGKRKLVGKTKVPGN